MRTPKETLDTVIPRFLRDGWQTVRSYQSLVDDSNFLLNLILQNVHAIGDRANSIVLDSFELASKTTNVPAMRPRIEHAQILRKSDMPRLGRLGGEHLASRSTLAVLTPSLFSHCERSAYPCVCIFSCLL
jgi:hypothetical protein